jgi:iron complex outermembrane receptor protein
MYLPDTVLVPSFKYLGFKALNIGNARITGVEVTAAGEADYGSVKFNALAGYTYMQPIDINLKDAGGDDPDGFILKYRHKHEFKLDAEVETKRFLIGADFVYTGRMVNVDQVFTDSFTGNLFLPGYPDYRRNNKSAYALVDLRLAVKVTKMIRINLIARNLLNKEYIGRPGDIGPPRNITLQLRVTF